MGDEPDPEQREIYRLQLRRAAYDISDRLLEWHSHYALPVVPATMDEELPEILSHSTIAHNHIMTLYWAVCMQLVPLHTVLNRPGEPMEDRFDVWQYCTDTIRATRLFTHPAAGLYRQHITPFPLNSALQFLTMIGEDHMKDERKYLWEILNHPECASVRDLILSMESEEVKPLTMDQMENK